MVLSQFSTIFYGTCTIYSTLQVFLAHAFLLYCVKPIWGWATLSQINFLGSIQVCKPHIQHSNLESYTFTAIHS